jgi:hypothetical protein
MAERADARFGKTRRVEQVRDEMLPDLARGSSHKDQHALPPATANIRWLRASTRICHTYNNLIIAARDAVARRTSLTVLQAFA